MLAQWLEVAVVPTVMADVGSAGVAVAAALAVHQGCKPFAGGYYGAAQPG